MREIRGLWKREEASVWLYKCLANFHEIWYDVYASEDRQLVLAPKVDVIMCDIMHTCCMQGIRDAVRKKRATEMRVCLLVPQHYRDVLKLLQTVLNHTRVKEEDYAALLRVVQELQVGEPTRYMLRVVQELQVGKPARYMLRVVQELQVGEPTRYMMRVVQELQVGKPARCMLLQCPISLCCLMVARSYAG